METVIGISTYDVSNDQVDTILTKLESYISNKYIICLRGCDLFLAGSGIHQLYVRSNYYTVTVESLMISFPTESYDLLVTYQFRIGDHINVSIDRNSESKRRSIDVDHDVFSDASRKNNILLYVTLEDKIGRKAFVVSSYIIPKPSWWASAVTLHVDAFMYIMDDITNDLPCISYCDISDFSTDFITKLVNGNRVPESALRPTPLWEPRFRGRAKIIDNKVFLRDCTDVSHNEGLYEIIL